MNDLLSGRGSGSRQNRIPDTTSIFKGGQIGRINSQGSGGSESGRSNPDQSFQRPRVESFQRESSNPKPEPDEGEIWHDFPQDEEEKAPDVQRQENRRPTYEVMPEEETTYKQRFAALPPKGMQMLGSQIMRPLSSVNTESFGVSSYRMPWDKSISMGTLPIRRATSGVSPVYLGKEISQGASRSIFYDPQTHKKIFRDWVTDNVEQVAELVYERVYPDPKAPPFSNKWQAYNTISMFKNKRNAIIGRVLVGDLYWYIRRRGYRPTDFVIFDLREGPDKPPPKRGFIGKIWWWYKEQTKQEAVIPPEKAAEYQALKAAPQRLNEFPLLEGVPVKVFHQPNNLLGFTDDEINRMSAGKPARTGGEDEDIWRQGAALMNEAKNDPNIKYIIVHCEYGAVRSPATAGCFKALVGNAKEVLLLEGGAQEWRNFVNSPEFKVKWRQEQEWRAAKGSRERRQTEEIKAEIAYQQGQRQRIAQGLRPSIEQLLKDNPNMINLDTAQPSTPKNLRYETSPSKVNHPLFIGAGLKNTGRMNREEDPLTLEEGLSSLDIASEVGMEPQGRDAEADADAWDFEEYFTREPHRASPSIQGLRKRSLEPIGKSRIGVFQPMPRGGIRRLNRR